MLTLCIEDTNIMGNGVAKVDGMVVFCNGTVAGDAVIALITDVKKSYAEAKVLKMLQSSPCRTEPRCIHSERCGGCVFSGVSYEHELYVKKCGIEAAFRRCGSFSERVERVIPSQTLEYRNKAVFHFDKDSFGYFANSSHDFVCADNCRIVTGTINNIRKEAEKILRSQKDSFAGEFTYLYIRYMKKTDEASVVLGYTGEESLAAAANELCNSFPCIKCFMRGRGENPSRDKFCLVSGNEYITDELLGMKLQISPKAFYQVNGEGAESLCRTVSDLAGLKEGGVCLDLYCGIGTIGLAIAKENPGAKVYGVEINPEAAENAVQNAGLNSLSNARFFKGDSADFAEIADNLLPDCIVTDPPRAGLSDKTVRELLKTGCEKIIYVSCNPSTMARDIKALSTRYEIKGAVGIDMFPGTCHVETVCRLVLRNP